MAVKSQGEPGGTVFVLGVWGVMLLGAALFVAVFGAEFPISEDYGYVPAVTGEEPLTLGWLWSWVNEFRFPLTKLVLVGAFKVAGADFRAGLFLSVAVLGILALGMVVAARRLRGGTRYTDAVFPLICLNWGHHACFLWSSAFIFVFSTAVVSGLLLLIVGRRTVTTAAGLWLLPLCGPMALAFMPALLIWVWLAAVLEWRLGERKGRVRGALMVALTVPAMVLAALYFRGYQRPPHHSPPGGLWDVSRTLLQYLSLGFGPAAAKLWPVSGAVVPCLLVVAVVVLMRAWVARPEERLRALGLLAFLGGTLSLAVGLGWGRSGMGEAAGFQDRYSPLAIPTLCGIYFALELYAALAVRRFVLMGMLLLATAMLWGNAEAGLKHGEEVAAESASFRKDIGEGLPAYVVVKRHTPFLHPSQEALERPMAMLKRAGVGAFRFLRDNPPFREVEVPLTPSEVRLLRWENGKAEVTGVDPWISFKVAKPGYVAGIRLRYSHSNRTATSAHFKVAWKRPGEAQYPAGQDYSIWALPTGKGQEVTIWTCEEVGEFRIQPDNQPCEFEISGLWLLLPSR